MNHKNKLIETLMLYKNGKAIDSDIIRAIEKSYVEISFQLQIPVNNVKVKLLRAKRLLAEVISKKND